MKKIDLFQKVPAHLAFPLMLILSFLLSWYTVTTAQKVAEEASNSGSFDVGVRLQKENSDLLK